MALTKNEIEKINTLYSELDKYKALADEHMLSVTMLEHKLEEAFKIIKVQAETIKEAIPSSTCTKNTTTKSRKRATKT